MTGKPKANGPDLRGPIERFRFLGDDRLVGLCDDAVIAWEPMTGKEESCIATPRTRDRNSDTVFSPSGDRLVYMDKEGTIISWNPRTGAVVKTPVKRGERKPEDFGSQLTIDGRLYIARDGDTLTFRNPLDGKILLQRSVPQVWRPCEEEGPLSVRAVSPDGKRLAAAHNNYPKPSPVVLLDLTDAKAEATVLKPGYHVSTLTISPDSRYLVATGENETRTEFGFDRKRMFTVWDLKSPEKSQTHLLPCWSILSTQFAPDGKLLAIHGGDRVLLLDTATWTEKAKVWTARKDYSVPLPGEEEGDTLAWSPSGRLLAVQLGDERLAVWDVARLLGK
jgi:WD40 repeat protein